MSYADLPVYVGQNMSSKDCENSREDTPEPESNRWSPGVKVELIR